MAGGLEEVFMWRFLFMITTFALGCYLAYWAGLGRIDKPRQSLGALVCALIVGFGGFAYFMARAFA